MNFFKSITRIIVATAIGSACWEFFLKELTVKASRFIIKFLANVSDGVINNLYDKISYAEMSFIVFPKYMFLIFVALFYTVIITFASLLNNKEVRSQIDEGTSNTNVGFLEKFTNYAHRKIIFRRFTLFYFVAFISGIFTCALLMIEIMVGVFKYSNKVSLERHIEIVRPYSGEELYRIHRSMFHLINTREQYLYLDSLLRNIAKKNTIHLPPNETLI